MKLYHTLEKQLQKEPNFTTDDGELKKWVVLDKARKNDAELLSLLLQHKTLKEKFFQEKEIDQQPVLLFKQADFLQFLEQKNYLNDSYTQYRNKVGLQIDSRYLNQRNEVELVWPYKDCILEGGQTKEEQKREEIFFNQTLAQDEITQLLEPKVLTNLKRYDKNGVSILSDIEHSRNDRQNQVFSRDAEFNKKRGLPENTITDNLILKGNNLLALHSLKKEFAGKVKLIYIDPPYNTGSDSFGYNDRFNHSTWLTFMKNRLEVAKTLLKKDGVIFVQCSFHQFAYLKILMNDIFRKHLCDFNIQVRHPQRALTGDKEFNDVIEYLLIYTNNKNVKMPIQEEKKTVDAYKYQITIKEKAKPTVIKCGKKNVEVFTPNQYQEVKTKPNKNGLKRISIRGSIREKNSSGRFFVKYLEILENYPPKTLFKVPNMGDDALDYRFFYSAPKNRKNGGYYQGMPTSSKVTKKQYPNFYNFEKEYNNVSKQGGVEFRNGKKPEELIDFIMQIFTKPNDIVFDFHLGSGTTASVAHKKKRQYLGIEQISHQVNLSLIRLQNVINGDSTGISKSVNWQGGGSFTYLELKKYNQHFIEQIEKAKTTKALLKVWEEMKANSFIDYNVDLQKQEKHIEEFKKLKVQEQKEHLCAILDKNQLYVNLSSMEDEDFKCNAEEKKITKDFYQLK